MNQIVWTPRIMIMENVSADEYMFEGQAGFESSVWDMSW